jgi:hypothetical protein
MRDWQDWQVAPDPRPTQFTEADEVILRDECSAEG